MKKEEIRIAIHQPGYHRYTGYFYKMLISDVFISLDTVQYVSREWQNRQKFFVDGKYKWLSIPVNRGREPISKKKIANNLILKNHWEFITYIYKNAPYFSYYRHYFESLYSAQWISLNEFTTELILLCKYLLGINTFFLKASAIDPTPDPTLNKANLLIHYIKKAVNINKYSKIIYHPRGGPIPEDFYLYKKYAGSSLREIDKFKINGIEVLPYKFSHPKYHQSQSNLFIENLSIVDLIFNTGESALDILIEANGGKIAYI
jgi:hypothetical protein